MPYSIAAFQHEPDHVGGKVAAFSAVLPLKRYSARRAGGYYFPKIDENPWERRSVALQRRSGNMRIDPVRLSCDRIQLSSPPAASTPSKTDLLRDGRGQHVKLRKAGFADLIHRA